MLISLSDIQQNDDATPDLFNSRLDAIVDVINGNIDAQNIADGSIGTAELANLAVTAGKIADTTITRPKIDWSSFTNNVKSALNTSSPSLSNTSQDLASTGLTLSFTVSAACKALVFVSLGVSSNSDYEFRPEIRLGGSVVASLTPAAALSSASGRANVRAFSAVVSLVSGANTISAGVTLASSTSPGMTIGGGSISAIVLGDVTA